MRSRLRFQSSQHSRLLPFIPYSPLNLHPSHLSPPPFPRTPPLLSTRFHTHPPSSSPFPSRRHDLKPLRFPSISSHITLPAFLPSTLTPHSPSLPPLNLPPLPTLFCRDLLSFSLNIPLTFSLLVRSSSFCSPFLPPVSLRRKRQSLTLS